MRRILKIISGLITTVLFITLIFLAIAVISSKASGGEPNFFGYQLKTVLSGSMEPTFKTGSIIAIKPVNNPTNLKKGDIITFKNDQSTIVTHRIFEVIQNNGNILYKTKGDNNESPDAIAVQSQNVIGRYTGFTISYLGYFQDFAKSKNGAALLLILPGVLLLGYSIFTIVGTFKEIDKTNKSKDANKTA